MTPGDLCFSFADKSIYAVNTPGLPGAEETTMTTEMFTSMSTGVERGAVGKLTEVAQDIRRVLRRHQLLGSGSAQS